MESTACCVRILYCWKSLVEKEALVEKQSELVIEVMMTDDCGSHDEDGVVNGDDGCWGGDDV